MRLNIWSGIVLGMVCLSLAGCANKGWKKNTFKNKNKRGSESAMTQGYESSTEFAGQDSSSELNDSQLSSDARGSDVDKNTYLFAFDRFEVADHDMASINAHADYLVKNPSQKIYINGHTDERGSREYNVALGERRAKAVTQILISKGVSPRQIKVVSYGAEKPAVQGNDESAYSKNRRAQTVYE